MNIRKQFCKFCAKEKYLSDPDLRIIGIAVRFAKYCMKKERKRKLKISKNRVFIPDLDRKPVFFATQAEIDTGTNIKKELYKYMGIITDIPWRHLTTKKNDCYIVEKPFDWNGEWIPRGYHIIAKRDNPICKSHWKIRHNLDNFTIRESLTTSEIRIGCCLLCGYRLIVNDRCAKCNSKLF